MEFGGFQRKILKFFKLNGFSLRAEAANRLASELVPLPPEDRQLWMMKIVEKLQELSIGTLAVDLSDIEKCLQECTRRHASHETRFNVISGFEIPSFFFDAEKCKFLRDDAFEKEKQLLPAPHLKSHVLRRRYALLLNILKRKDLFKGNTLRNIQAEHKLTRAEEFLCSSERIDNALMFGLLVHRGGEKYEIEDISGSLKLDLSQCEYTRGLFVENCFVLVQGAYVDSVFHAQLMTPPMLECPEESRSYYANKNTFGGPSETSLTQSGALKQLEKENPDAQIVFLADVWLDNHRVMKKLNTLFNGFSDCPPMAFVLFGNFLQEQPGPKYPSKLKEAFSKLADMIVSVPRVLEYSHIVLVPGPKDPGSPLIYPRASFMEYLVEGLRQKVPKIVLATNPCRIQICTKEVVCMRADLLTKMCRNAIHFPADDIPGHFSRTLLSNGTLSPMSLYALPVHWAYSEALDLYPLPDLVVVADQLNNFVTKDRDVKSLVANPGTFLRKGFHVYYPFKHTIEESHVPDDEND